MMINLLRFIINKFDFFYQKKILRVLGEHIKNNAIIIDVGSHHGETINLMLRNFDIKEIHGFEASPINFNILKKKIDKKNKKILINIIGLGKIKEVKTFNQVKESSSSTFNKLNTDSKYYKKKNRILSLLNSKIFYKEIDVNVMRLDEYLMKVSMPIIDLLKIDTEGFEFNVLKGAGEYIKKINIIYFEHHYDNMIIKNYKFGDINDYLIRNNFKKIFKIKMPFRKSYEYIYINLKIC